MLSGKDVNDLINVDHSTTGCSSVPDPTLSPWLCASKGPKKRATKNVQFVLQHCCKTSYVKPCSLATNQVVNTGVST